MLFRDCLALFFYSTVFLRLSILELVVFGAWEFVMRKETVSVLVFVLENFLNEFVMLIEHALYFIGFVGCVRLTGRLDLFLEICAYLQIGRDQLFKLRQREIKRFKELPVSVWWKKLATRGNCWQALPLGCFSLYKTFIGVFVFKQLHFLTQYCCHM